MPHSPSAAGANDALYRRVAFALIPFLFLCYVVAMVDRLNVGYAKLQFMADLHFDESVFGMAAGVLYVGYILFEVPSNLMLERVGLAVTLLAHHDAVGRLHHGDGVRRRPLELLLRPLHDRRGGGRLLSRRAVLLDAVVSQRLAGAHHFAVRARGAALGRPRGAAVERDHGRHGRPRRTPGWRWLFLIEGAPAIALGLAAWLILPDRPASARFLSDEEKRAIAVDLAAEAGARGASGSFAAALRDRRTYILALVYFAFYSTQSILLLWVPTLLRNAGAHDLQRNRLARRRRCSSPGRSAWRDRLELRPPAGAPLASVGCGIVASAALLPPCRSPP